MNAPQRRPLRGHQPLQHIAPIVGLAKETAIFLCQPKHDGPGFHNGLPRLAIADGRDLAIWRKREDLRTFLLAVPKINAVNFIVDAELLEQT